MMIKIWAESAGFNLTSQRLIDQMQMISKKGWFSEL